MLADSQTPDPVGEGVDADDALLMDDVVWKHPGTDEESEEPAGEGCWPW